MHSFRLVAVLAVTMSSCPSYAVHAAQHPLASPAATGQKLPIAQDVSLQSEGRLEIQMIDAQGRPHAGTPISVYQSGKLIHEATTQSDGKVPLPHLKPGIYEIRSGSQGGVYRLWAPQTAPPRAASGILLIDDGSVVRAARGGWQKAALVSGVIVTSGVLGGVIGYNLKDAS